MKEIQLTQGKVTIVDDEDFEALNAFKWFARHDRRTFYATRKLPRMNGVQPNEQLHRVVLSRKLGRSIADGMFPDHIDGNGLNNLRSNLREVTCRGNSENLHVAKTSRYLGVCWHRPRQKWMAQVRVSGRQTCIGYYPTELSAAIARDSYISQRPSINARLNFAKETP